MASEPNVAEMSVEELVDAYNAADRPNIYGQELMRRLTEAIESANTL
jgi:hypothetical protein